MIVTGLESAQQTQPIHAGVMIACSGQGGDALGTFGRELAEDVGRVLEQATGRRWNFHVGEGVALEGDDERRAADFVGEASLRLTEGSFDLMLVLTDVPLMSEQARIVSGLASPLTRLCVMSVRQLRTVGRGPALPLDAPEVRADAASLALHLIGKVIGAPIVVPTPGAEGESSRNRAPDCPARLRQLVARFPERELCASGPLRSLWAHLGSIAADPVLVLRALIRNRAPLLPLRLPGLAAAAVAPIFLLVFTAEFWDAGLGMSNRTAATYAAISIAAATLYLTFGQRLFLPRKDNGVIPEHLALANVVIFLTVLLAVIGLFAMVALLTLAIELWIFPADLIATWPTLQDPEVTLVDKARLATFISTIGVTTGALAGGLERTQVMRHLALFQASV